MPKWYSLYTHISVTGNTIYAIIVRRTNENMRLKFVGVVAAGEGAKCDGSSSCFEILFDFGFYETRPEAMKRSIKLTFCVV